MRWKRQWGSCFGVTRGSSLDMLNVRSSSESREEICEGKTKQGYDQCTCQWVPGVKDFETSVFSEARSDSKETWHKEKSLSAPARRAKSMHMRCEGASDGMEKKKWRVFRQRCEQKLSKQTWWLCWGLLKGDGRWVSECTIRKRELRGRN